MKEPDLTLGKMKNVLDFNDAENIYHNKIR